MVPMKEADIQRAIKAKLKELYGIECFKHHGGPYSERGVADLIGCWQGRFVALEVKKPGSKEKNGSVWQQAWLRRYAEVGAIVGVVASVDEAVAIIESHLSTENR